jgi:hypothetical protein
MSLFLKDISIEETYNVANGRYRSKKLINFFIKMRIQSRAMSNINHISQHIISVSSEHPRKETLI